MWPRREATPVDEPAIEVDSVLDVGDTARRNKDDNIPGTEYYLR
jgi:hypothetical protein